ncbi:GDP-mannose 4,6 dehydratase, partial [Undibacterium sp. TJN25]
RTVVQAYTRLLQHAPAGQTFNVCSGQAHTLQQVLDIVADLAGYRMEVRVNPAFVRSNEVKTLTGNPNKLAACVGALPGIALRDTLAWMLGAVEGKG